MDYADYGLHESFIFRVIRNPRNPCLKNNIIIANLNFGVITLNIVSVNLNAELAHVRKARTSNSGLIQQNRNTILQDCNHSGLFLISVQHCRNTTSRHSRSFVQNKCYIL